MVNIHTDEFNDQLFIDGEEYYSEGDGFEVPSSVLQNARLSDLPRGISVRLCDKVLGSLSGELFPRSPHCAFEHTPEGLFVCRTETAFFPPENAEDQESIRLYFERAISSARNSLSILDRAGRLESAEAWVVEDLAYFNYSIILDDLLFVDAESYVQAIEDRIHVGSDRPLIFICYASEDRRFVDVLVKQLDRHALYAWYDEREILVGDSIVDKVDAALRKLRFLIPVLSRNSVRKPWVRRELNSTLMRKLHREKIDILPVLLSDCEIPALLTDLKYADFRASFDTGFRALLNSIRRRESQESLCGP